MYASVAFRICFAISVPDLTYCMPKTNKKELFEGDISVTRKELRKMSKDIKKTGGVGVSLWENGIVPFVLSNKFSEPQRGAITNAMDEISGDTCIQFVPRGNHKDYLDIKLADKCSSKVGRNGGAQEVLMNPTCRQGTIVHELMHSLGFWHEQSRPDRDKYIMIKTENIRPDKGANFKTYENPFSRTYDLPYDYASIMHYSGYAFQKKSGLKTIVPKMDNAPIGLRDSMSYFDKLKINIAYNCDNR